MDSIDLKKSFHVLIDRIENEHLLMNFYDLIKSRLSMKDGQLWNRLTLTEQQELLLALNEIEDPTNLISNEEMKKKHEKWL
ncbi:MAG: hypothetical protein HN921_00590 [Bacteroidetes bacterium]|jgi:hypothetical protein|nr:hypothetical protein [Bacteroidota bacterium]MBT4727940.1 hypothetical protein [Bacteroidota bacterium]MBT6836058.1 hypothetical protein [Bacteroidota bacterium]MBT7038311.1 hypothetical protein [Bacteroidota bacterium]MBT7826391.1 hypothetical protein [Bacteroidota bacterium]